MKETLFPVWINSTTSRSIQKELTFSPIHHRILSFRTNIYLSYRKLNWNRQNFDSFIPVPKYPKLWNTVRKCWHWLNQILWKWVISSAKRVHECKYSLPSLYKLYQRVSISILNINLGNKVVERKGRDVDQESCQNVLHSALIKSLELNCFS